MPNIKINTIQGKIWRDFKQKIDNGEIEDAVRPEKGLFILRKYLKEKKFGGKISFRIR